MLSAPTLAKCDDRADLPKNHPTSHTPEEWLGNNILSTYHLFGISFDFFVNWTASPPSLTPTIWIKRILLSPHTYQDLIPVLREQLIIQFSEDYLRRLLLFATKFKLAIQFIIFRDDSDWGNDASSILIAALTKGENDELILVSETITITQFKEKIKQHSGGPVSIGSKGLIFGTSNLECFLSKTDSAYPGDADLVIFNEDIIPKAIIELKKHTKTTSISDQKLKNYYPTPDGRKYDRLAILKNYFSQKGNSVPLIVVYYPTLPAHTEYRIELVHGNISELVTRASKSFLLPLNNSPDQFKLVAEKLNKTIIYHYSL